MSIYISPFSRYPDCRAYPTDVQNLNCSIDGPRRNLTIPRSLIEFQLPKQFAAGLPYTDWKLPANPIAVPRRVSA